MICQPLHPLSHSYQCRTLPLSTVAMATVWQGWAVSKALWSLAKTPLHTYLCYVALIPSFWSSFDGDIKPGGIQGVPLKNPVLRLLLLLLVPDRMRRRFSADWSSGPAGLLSSSEQIAAHYLRSTDREPLSQSRASLSSAPLFEAGAKKTMNGKLSTLSAPNSDLKILSRLWGGTKVWHPDFNKTKASPAPGTWS